jgi:hypothetical protein
MDDDELDIPDDCWIPAQGPLQVGDVLSGLPFMALDDLDAVIEDEDHPRDLYLPAYTAYGVLVKLTHGQGIVAPIITYEVASDEIRFENLLELGHDERHWVTLPRLLVDGPEETGWWDAAVALLFVPSTYHEQILARLLVRSMSDTARAILEHRTARCFEP